MDTNLRKSKKKPIPAPKNKKPTPIRKFPNLPTPKRKTPKILPPPSKKFTSMKKVLTKSIKKIGKATVLKENLKITKAALIIKMYWFIYEVYFELRIEKQSGADKSAIRKGIDRKSENQSKKFRHNTKGREGKRYKREERGGEKGDKKKKECVEGEFI